MFYRIGYKDGPGEMPDNVLLECHASNSLMSPKETTEYKIVRYSSWPRVCLLEADSVHLLGGNKPQWSSDFFFSGLKSHCNIS